MQAQNSQFQKRKCQATGKIPKIGIATDMWTIVLNETQDPGSNQLV